MALAKRQSSRAIPLLDSAEIDHGNFDNDRLKGTSSRHTHCTRRASIYRVGVVLGLESRSARSKYELPLEGHKKI